MYDINIVCVTQLFLLPLIVTSRELAVNSSMSVSMYSFASSLRQCSIDVACIQLSTCIRLKSLWNCWQQLLIAVAPILHVYSLGRGSLMSSILFALCVKCGCSNLDFPATCPLSNNVKLQQQVCVSCYIYMNYIYI